MLFAEVAFLTMVVAAFIGYAVVLFAFWIWTNWAEWFAGPHIKAHAPPKNDKPKPRLKTPV